MVAATRELRLANQELAERERHLRTLINAAPVGIAELDVQGHCRYLNPVGCVLTGCPEPVSYTHLDVYKRQEFHMKRISLF